MTATADVQGERGAEPLAGVVALAKCDDADAARALFDRFSNRVLGYCVLAMNGDRETATDITQEVFLRVFEKLHTLDDPERFEPWLWTIARREISRRASSSSRYGAVLELFELDRDVLYADDDKRGRERRIATVQSFLEQVEDERLREIVLLKYTEPEHTTREIAEKLDIPHGTVTVSLMRFRQKNRARLDDALRSLDLEPAP